MKNYTLFKHLYCLLPLFLLTGIIATCSLNADTITSFPPTDFIAVDHTTPKYTYGGGRQYNPTGIIGYKYKPQNINLPNIENAYQLTDTIQSMTVALWHKQKLDLNQDWQFDCDLFFDTGSALVNTNIQVGRADRMIADGFCFVLNNKDTLENLIGGKQMEIGYGGISPSFAIEFDTEDNGYREEGADGQLLSSGSHISYLRDGAMKVIPGSLSQMQNGWGTVASSQWYKVRIVWRKVYENNTTYYELSTYMEEKNDINSPLLLRSSMRFNSLSEVIAGLEVDENCQALVNWGITSSTCQHSNRQMINFVKLETAEEALIRSPGITAVMAGRCGIVHYVQPPNSNQETQSDSTGSQPNFYEYYDTILQPSDIPDCYSAGSQPARDTIEYTISCDDLRYSYACNYELEFYDMPDDADAVCQYYFNDTLIDSVVYNDSTSPWRVELLPSRFPIDRSDASRFNWRSMSLKIIIDGVEYNFKFSYNDNTTEMANYLAQLPNIQLDADMHGGTLTLDSNTLTQSIQLPASSDCSYNIGMYSPSTSFAIPPSIDSNNVLHFELKADVCSINLPIFLQCECGGLFDLTVKNSSCPESACEFVTIAAVPKITDTVSTGGKYGTGINLPAYDPWSYNNTEYIVTSATGSGNGISYVTVNEIMAQGKYASIKNQTVTSLNDTSYNVLISFITPICGDSATVANYKICAYLTNGAVCCDTFSFYLHCVPPPDMLIREWSAYRTITYQILNVALFYSPTVPPLYVKVFDGTGTQLITTLHSTIPTSLTGSISYGHLPIGTYNIVFQWGNYIWTVKVVNTGGSR